MLEVFIIQKQKFFFHAYLRGAAQVTFSSNVMTGLIFLVAIFYGAFSTSMISVAIGAIAGLVFSTLTAQILGHKQSDIEQGLFGYNGLLIGIAIPTFFESSLGSWILLISLAILSTPLVKKMNAILSTLKLPSLTFPFVFLVWIGIFLGRYFLHQESTSVEIIKNYSIWSVMLEGFFKGFSQIFLINNPISGALILIGLFITSRSFAFWGIVSVFVTLALSYFFHFEIDLISSGIVSYNSILTCLALGIVFSDSIKPNKILIFLGIILSTVLHFGLALLMKNLNIPVLTAPFVFASWICLISYYRFSFYKIS